ncbi:hypothetical protein [Streptomyces sp. NPDC018031]|uniref:hypothetical protein n=1 Tax=Streptomyces sp. NPDC018031 TaxID=3365033 RepID=UPI0037BA543E
MAPGGPDDLGPLVEVVTFDGQVLTGRLLERWQAPSGTWFYTVSVTLWASVQTRDGQVVAEPADTIFDAPATHVHRIEGVSYEAVPTRRGREAIIRARTRGRR